NINCIFCHATFDNAARKYKINQSGTSPRSRIASLQQLNVGTQGGNSDAATNIRGTLYTFGNILSSETGANVPAGNTLPNALSTSGTPDVQFQNLDQIGRAS